MGGFPLHQLDQFFQMFGRGGNTGQGFQCIYQMNLVAFQKILVKECGTDIKKFLIADEVHHIGAPDALNGLPPLASVDYDFGLGLTATLKRYFDDVGTDFIKNYFHGVVYTYTMAQAIKDGILCKYKYHMLEVDLTEKEYAEYQVESITMAQWYTKSKKDLLILQ